MLKEPSHEKAAREDKQIEIEASKSLKGELQSYNDKKRNVVDPEFKSNQSNGCKNKFKPVSFFFHNDR
jgi:hypothetical protein